MTTVGASLSVKPRAKIFLSDLLAFSLTWIPGGRVLDGTAWEIKRTRSFVSFKFKQKKTKKNMGGALSSSPNPLPPPFRFFSLYSIITTPFLFSLADLSWPQAARMSWPRGHRTGARIR